MAKWSDRTHGRWPWLAAVAALPASAIFAANRVRLRENAAWAYWAPVPIYFWHQTEEWVWPGGFLPWFNREVLGSNEDEFPIDRRLGLLINAGLGWALATAAGMRGSRNPELASAVHGMLIGNAVIHIGATARARRYTPGVATGAGLMAPIGVASLCAIARHSSDASGRIAAGAGAGLGSGALLLAAMKARLRGLEGT